MPGRMGRDGYVIDPVRAQWYGVVHQFLPLASGAVNAADSVGIDGQADFYVDRQAVLADNLAAYLQFQISPGALVEDTAQFATTYGTGEFPRVLASPWMIPKGSTYTCMATDGQLVAAPNTVRFLSIGRKLYDQPYMRRRRYNLVRPFTLTANFTNSGQNQSGTIPSAGASMQASVNGSSEWDFELRKVVIASDGDFTVQIQTSGKAMQWFNRACHSKLLGGQLIEGPLIQAGAWPFVLPECEYVPATYGLQLTLNDLGTANSYPARAVIAFLGNRLYPPGGLEMM